MGRHRGIGAEETNPSIADMWPSSLPDIMHERLRR